MNDCGAEITTACEAGRSSAMNTIAVHYTLHQPGRYYERLWARLRQLGAVHVMDSFWMLKTNASTTDVFADIRRYVDANDEVLAMDVTDDNWWGNLKNQQVVAWMQANIPARRAA